jgi:DNA-binding LytR/AlgR family response regulator
LGYFPLLAPFILIGLAIWWFAKTEAASIAQCAMQPTTAVIAEDEPILAGPTQGQAGPHVARTAIVADVGDGEAALEAIDDAPPHLAFLDIQMPEMTGVDVARSLAANRDMRCHVVFVTAFDQYAVEAFDANAVDYVLKPVHRRTPAAAVDRLQERAWPPCRPRAGPGCAGGTTVGTTAPGQRATEMDQGQRGQPTAPDPD